MEGRTVIINPKQCPVIVMYDLKDQGGIGVTDKERLEKARKLVSDYTEYHKSNSVILTDYGIELIEWLIERVDELEEGVREAISNIEDISPHEGKKTLLNLIKNMEGGA